MKTNRIVTLILIIIINNILYSQRDISEVYILINDYERQYRTTLNESDLLLIAKQVNQIGSNCNMLEDILSSRQFSNNYKIALLNEFKSWKLCSSSILDYIDLSKENDEDNISMPPQISNAEVYPIYQNIVQSKDFYLHFTNYLLESDYLNSCEFLWENKSIPKIVMLSLLTNDINNILLNDESCKMANLIIIRGIKFKFKNVNNEK